MKQYMIDKIRSYWFYAENVLEEMTEEEVKEIYERLIDWLI